MKLLEQVDKYSGAIEKVSNSNGENGNDYEIVCLIGKLPIDWSNPNKKMLTKRCLINYMRKL
jgi:hypothetical protein